MFTKETINRTKAPAPLKPTPVDASFAEASYEQNPLWQSLALSATSIQPKLAVSQPDDPYEREADRVAERVMRMAVPQSGAPQSNNLPSGNTKLPSAAFVSRKVERKCDHCEEEEERLQRKEAEPQAFGVQMKSLAISAASDPDEKEADEVARRAVRPVEFQTPRQPLIMRQDEKKEIKKSTKPEIESWEYRNKKGQTVSPDNYCESCEGIFLGVNCLDPFEFSNGIELKVNIKNHTANYSYNIKRTFESKYWEKTETAKGNTWIQTRNKGKNVGSGTDDKTDNDEYLVPQQNANNPALYYIYSKDRPGLNRQQPQTTRDSREVLMISNFIESVEITDKKNKSYVDGKTFKWHTKLWVAWDSELGMWKVIEEKSSIGSGHVGLESPGAEKKVQKKSVDASSSTDPEEKEADEAARAIVDRWPVKIDSRQRLSRNGNGSAQTTPEFQSQLERSKGNGQSLPRAVQIEMGRRMGTDLSDVRVHTGSAAHELSKSINARAFTLGSDVYFRQGEFNTVSRRGKELLAHELVHTQQQKGGLKRQVQRNGVTKGVNDLLDFTGINSLVETGTDLYHYATDSEEEFEKYMQAQLAAHIYELQVSTSPSLQFTAAYFGLISFASTLNPFSLFMMPSVDALWSIYVKGKLGYYTYLYQLGREHDVQKKKNPNYQKGGYAKVFGNQMKNLIDPMFVWGEVKGIFKGIGKWFKDIWEMIKWLVSFIPSSITDSWNLLAHQQLPPWMKTIATHATTSAEWLAKNGTMLLDFAGEMISNPAELKKFGHDLKAALKVGSANAAFAAGAGVAKEQVSAMGMPAEQQGEMLGKAIGYLIPEIILAIFTETIVNWIKAGVVALRGFWTAIKVSKVMTKVFEMARGVGEAFGNFASAIKGVANGKFKKLGEMFEKVLEYFKGMGKVEKELPKLKTAEEVKGAKVKSGTKSDAHEPKTGEHKASKEKAEPKGQKGKVPSDFAELCTIGSLLCEQGVPANVRAKVGDCPHPDVVPEPTGAFELRGLDDATYVKLRSQAYTRWLRKQVMDRPDLWTEEFRLQIKAAEEAATKAGRKFDPLKRDWPKDLDGNALEVHHKKPLDFGGDNSAENLIPIDGKTHLDLTNWWNRVKRETGKHFTQSEWDELIGGSKTEIFDPARATIR